MHYSRYGLSITLVAIALAGCTTIQAPNMAHFAVDLENGERINNEEAIIDSVATPQTPGIYIDTVEASTFDCPEMPCNDAERAAQEQANLDYRRPPEDQNATTF